MDGGAQEHMVLLEKKVVDVAAVMKERMARIATVTSIWHYIEKQEKKWEKLV